MVDITIDGTTYAMRLHPRDDWHDAVVLLGPTTTPLLRLVLREEFQDGWHFNAIWQGAREQATWSIVERPPAGSAGWQDIGPHLSGEGVDPIATGCARLYPIIDGFPSDVQTLPIAAIHIMRKGRILHHIDGDNHPLLTVAGYLPWLFHQFLDLPRSDAPYDDPVSDALLMARRAAWDEMERLCFQPGCGQEAISTCRLLACYNEAGQEMANTTDEIDRLAAAIEKAQDVFE